MTRNQTITGYPLYPASVDIYNQQQKIYDKTVNVNKLQIHSEKDF